MSEQRQRSKSPQKKRAREESEGKEEGSPEQRAKKLGIGFSADRPARIYCDGIYDLFHFGHARALEQAKKAFPHVHLLVGVCNDELTHSKKGKTVMNAHERAESLRHCKWVDEVIENAPWIVDQEYLDKHQIDFVAHDDIPYQSAGVADVYAFVKEQGKFLATKRTEGISTSDLITRIVRDYDKYVRRNLDRGVPAKELNISFLKEKEYQVKKQVEDITGVIKQNWAGTKDELKRTIDVWDDISHEWVRGFLSLFGNEGPVKKFLERVTSPVLTAGQIPENSGGGESSKPKRVRSQSPSKGSQLKNQID